MKRKRGSEQILLGKDEVEFKGSEFIRSAILELAKISSLRHHHEPSSLCDSKNDAATTAASTASTSTDHCKTHDHDIPTIPFLHVCKFLLLEVLDKVGPTMAVLRQDVNQNIQRLEKLHDIDPSMYKNVVGILKKENREGTSRKTNSCTRALVWLTRSMDFAVSLLEKLSKEPDGNLKKAIEESYEITLKPWHQWISTAAYRVALRLVPEDAKTFINLLMAPDEDYDDLKEEILSLVSSLRPILNEIHCILRSFQSDRLKSNSR
ncbi:hypothetical protein MKW94_024052 [Papaver nudicaule]|uniref:Glycolipid transfer protein domain-containing protein n=1 Tax=Papaver nudicaule TaxID=74823 RepID=A0AA41RVD1_PAPNU|nr:hypothetical protein [Papaver nudicaule]